ncbi:nitroreductase family protein [Pseudoclavibacter terrae]|uniref:nitroreductase family protein n=1 Tax=Pseudoclavibacter terrae TaxID=1530195 RepID=UPI00232A9C9E|nr:nitroreductase family protein [Pseudoclavibacter terrae]
MTEQLTVRNETSVPILDALSDRWSPRGFDADHAISDEDLTAIFEAGRWAPSASNTQPTTLVAGVRGTATFDQVYGTLMDFNLAWADRASLLIAVTVEHERDGKALRWAEYDAGAVAAHLSIEAQSRGLHTHQMGGFHVDALAEALELPAGRTPITVIAVGQHDDSDAVSEQIRARDTSPRSRRELTDFASIER